VRAPETRFVETADGVSLAYQVFGGGADLVWMPNFLFNLDMLWDFPPLAAFLEELGTFTRVLLHDRRGTGLSDREPEPPNLETRMDDLLVILDAAEMSRPTLVGNWEAGAFAALVTATHPKRVASLVMWGASVRHRWAEDYPWGETRAEEEASIDQWVSVWGTEQGARLALEDAGPGTSEVAAYVAWMGRMLRNAVTKKRAESLLRMWDDTDVRDVLPSIQTPTMVVSRSGVQPDEGAYVASLIPGAEHVVLAGDFPMPWFGDVGAVMQTLRRFLGIAPTAVDTDRFLATVLFTDIVGSTERASELGDRAWKEVVESHHLIVRNLLDRYRGQEMDTAGDGFYATFDGPARAVRCAREIVDAVRPLGIQIRAGLHTGECQLVDGKFGGLAVSIGARVAAKSEQSEILATSTVKDLTAGSGLAFEDAGEHELKGVPDRWRLYRVVSG